MLLVSGFAYFYYNQLNSNVKYVSVFGHQVKKTKANTGGAENILVVGSDSRVGATPAELAAAHTTSDGGAVNTDTIIVVHLAADNGPVTFISIPRDSVVDIPGHTAFKINSAYEDGQLDHAKNPNINGATLLTETVENLTGAHIDHFIMVSLFNFISISNDIGGVRVCLTKAQHEPLSGIDLPAGYSTIKGSQALAFVRQRHGLPDGDFDRIKRQQRFISALVKKAKNERNPLTVNAVLQKATSSITADSGLNGAAFLKLANRMRSIDLSKIDFLTIPTVNKGAYGHLPGYTGEISYVKVDPSAVQTFVGNVLAGRNPYASPAAGIDQATAIPASNVTVSVLNGSGISGAAGRTSRALQQYGFHIATVGNAVHGKTTIRYNSGDAGAAKTLAKAVPGAALVADDSLSSGTVQLTVGTDFTSVRNPAAASTPTPSASASPSASPLPAGTTAADQNCGP